MAKDNYDRDEMEMRSVMFEIAKLQAISKSLGVVLEWEKLIKEYPTFATDYPVITELVKANREFLDPDNWSNNLLLNNPLIKLAFISQAPPKKEEKDDSNPEKSPG